MRHGFALALGCGLLGAPLLAADPPPAARVEVPYKLTDTKHVMVRAKINGKGPFNLILDTGAPAVFITKTVAKKAGVDFGEKKGLSTFDRFEIEGGLVVEGARGRVEDLVQLDGMNGLGLAGVELHGVIGYNVLAKFRIEYDFTRDRLGFEPLPGFDPPPLVPLAGKGADTLQAMGPMVKMLAAMMGIKPNFEVVPRGVAGFEYEDKDGVVVTRVLAGSPAAAAGLKVGDTIAGVKATDVDNSATLTRALAKAQPGTKLSFRVKRSGAEETVTIELGKGL